MNFIALTLALATVATATAAPSQDQDCEGSDFKCPAGNCIPASWICDGDNDCTDLSDEQDCHCDGFVCPSGRCIYPDWVCDGDKDCDDGADEENCSSTSSTPCSSGFICPNTGSCLPDSWICDGEDDCGDFSDESEEACPCVDDEVRCPRSPDSEFPGACIPPEYICDEEGIWDCDDGSDESNCTSSSQEFDANSPRYRPETIKAAKEHKLSKSAGKKSSKSKHSIRKLTRRGAKI